MGHGSCIMGHGSLSVRVTGHGSLPALLPMPTAWPGMACDRLEIWRLATATSCERRRREPRARAKPYHDSNYKTATVAYEKAIFWNMLVLDHLVLFSCSSSINWRHTLLKQVTLSSAYLHTTFVSCNKKAFRNQLGLPKYRMVWANSRD